MMFQKLAATTVFLGILTACGGSGLCEGTGGVVDECFEGWTQAECDEWDAEGVNGATWTFHGSGSCEGLGYTYECDGAWLTTGSDCYSYTY